MFVWSTTVRSKGNCTKCCLFHLSMALNHLLMDYHYGFENELISTTLFN